MKTTFLKICITLSLISAGLEGKAEVAPPLDTVKLESLVQGYKTAYYWAFYGSYSQDSAALGAMVSRLSDLTSKIYDISAAEAYSKYKADVLAQGGPQLLLADVAMRRIAAGLQLGMANEVSAFINAAHKVNPQFAASLTMMALELKGNGVDRDIKDFALPPRASDIDQCAQSCAIHFLGLQNNRYARGIMGGREQDPRMYPTGDINQVRSRFPNQQNQNEARPRFRGGLNPMVAMTKECFTTCLNESVSAGLTHGIPAATAALIRGPQVALAVGTGVAIFTGTIQALQCSTSAVCAKDESQVYKEQQASRMKADNDLREQQLRKNDLDRREEEQKEKNAEAKKREDQRLADEAKAQRDQEKRDQEKRIRDSFDRTKNEEEIVDSSTSCESTKTCNGEMTATPFPPQYEVDKEPAAVMMDGTGKILTPIDLTGTPMPKNGEDEESSSLYDGNGNILTKMDLIFTPQYGEKEAPKGPMIDGTGKVLTKMDLVGTPILNIQEVEPRGPIGKDIGLVSRTTK